MSILMSILVSIYGIGTLAFLIVGVTAIYIAVDTVKWCIYGRATLIYVGLLLLGIATNRSIAIAGITTSAQARDITSLIVSLFGLTILMLGTLHWAQHHLRHKREAKFPLEFLDSEISLEMKSDEGK
jgi:hypothetical protein